MCERTGDTNIFPYFIIAKTLIFSVGKRISSNNHLQLSKPSNASQDTTGLRCPFPLWQISTELSRGLFKRLLLLSCPVESRDGRELQIIYGFGQRFWSLLQEKVSQIVTWVLWAQILMHLFQIIVTCGENSSWCLITLITHLGELKALTSCSGKSVPVGSCLHSQWWPGAGPCWPCTWKILDGGFLHSSFWPWPSGSRYVALRSTPCLVGRRGVGRKQGDHNEDGIIKCKYGK